MNRYTPPLTRWHLAAVAVMLLHFLTPVGSYKHLKMACCLSVAAGYLVLAVWEARRMPLLTAIYMVFLTLWAMISYLRYLLDYA